MTDSKYVVVYMSGNDLQAEIYEYYDDALHFVEEDIADDKAYIIRIEDYCAQGMPPIKITLEPHT